MCIYDVDRFQEQASNVPLPHDKIRVFQSVFGSTGTFGRITFGLLLSCYVDNTTAILDRSIFLILRFQFNTYEPSSVLPCWRLCMVVPEGIPRLGSSSGTCTAVGILFSK